MTNPENLASFIQDVSTVDAWYAEQYRLRTFEVSPEQMVRAIIALKQEYHERYSHLLYEHFPSQQDYLDLDLLDTDATQITPETHVYPQ